MKIKNFLFSFTIVFSVSCGETMPVSENADSSNHVQGKVSSVREIETDSGKLVITEQDGVELDSAVLYDASGVITARGFFYNNQPSGAWFHYDATGKIVSVKHYSQGAAKYNLDATDFKTKRVSFNEMGISAEIPEQWKSIETPNAGSLISYEKPVTEQGILMMPNFNIAKGKLEAGQTLKSLAADQLNMLHDAVGRVELVDESFLTIDSCSAFRRYGMYYTEDNKVGFLDAIIVKGDQIWVISCAAQNREQGEFLKYQSVFENLVMSIEIL